MNPTKKNNGWILCPSKSFPGKFYYFNVVNGETAWSLNEAEKQFVKNSQFQNIDKGHCYPEPTSPPADNSPHTVTKSTAYTPPTIHPQETNNFPSKITNVSSYQPPSLQPYQTHPVQIQVPMIAGFDYQNCGPNILMILMNQNHPRTQSAVEATTAPMEAPAPVEKFQIVPDRELFIHSGNQPIGQRIMNYEKPVLNFTKDNKISKPFYVSYGTSTPNKSNVSMFSHEGSSIDTCGLSKMLSNDGRTRRFIGEPILNLTPKVNGDKSPTALRNSCAKCPAPYPNVLTKNPSVSTSPLHPNPITLNSTNMFIHKTPFPKTTHILKARQELFPASPVEKQMKSDNLEMENHLDTNPFKNLKKITLWQSNRVDIPKSPFNAENILEKKSGMNSNEKVTLTQCEKVDSFSAYDVEHDIKLGEYDLRRILMANKRKSIDLDQAKFIEGKKTRIDVPESPVTPKKKVTFNLVPERISDYESFDHSSYDDTGCTEVNADLEDFNIFASASKRTKSWYIVADTNTLIEEFDFLDSFVRMDPKCHLIVPSRVLSETVALSRGESRERRRVTLARHSLRRLATPQPYITVQSAPIDDNMVDNSMEGSILNCCMECVKQNAHVMLVTNDDNLKSEAMLLSIPCFSTQQLKDNAVKKPEVQFDIKKVKISFSNIPETSNFEQEVPTHMFKNNHYCTDAKDKLTEDLPSSDINVGKPTWKFTAEEVNRDLKELKQFPCLFQIQKDFLNNSTQVLELPTTPKKPHKTIPNSKETRSFYFQNDDVVNLTDERQSEKETNTVSYYFQNKDKNKAQSVSSIFKMANDKKMKESQTKPSFEIENGQRNPKLRKSLVELEGIEKIKTNQVPMKPSIFDENFKPMDSQKPIFNNEKFKNIQIQFNNTICENSQVTSKEIPIKSSIFDWEKYKNNENQSTSPIFDKKNYNNIEVELNNSMFENDELQTKQTPKRSSVFEIENNINKEASVFDKEKYKNIEVQLNNSFCDNWQYTTEEIPMNSPVLNTEHYKYGTQSGPSIVYDEKQENRGAHLKPSIFEIDETVNPVLPNEYKDKFDFEEQIKKIFVKNNIEENIIEERREEFVCSFRQIMEDCLSNILQQSSFVHKSMPPPWSLHEALQCIVKLYGSHATIRTIMNFMNGVLNAKGEVLDSAVTAGIGCGLVLIDYLKKLTSNVEALTDAETALYSIIENCTGTIVEPVKAPGLNRSDIDSEEHTYRRNFVKRRSEVISYLKKHFSEWANYDETLDNTEPEVNLGQAHKNSQIVRTIGKNLSLLEINNSKTMTLNQPLTAAKAIENNSSKKQENTKNDNMKEDSDKNNAGLNVNNQNANPDKSSKRVIEKFRNLLQLSKNVDSKPKTEGNIVNTNTNIGEKERVPKIIRLSDNIHLTKEQIDKKNAKERQKPILDLEFSTHGHGFGTNEKAGPKIIRNVKAIEAFEEKLKKNIALLDSDELDHSDMSDGDDFIENDAGNDFVSKNNNDSKLHDEENDHLYSTNDKLPCDMKHFDNTSQRTNNCSHSMSFDDCVNDRQDDFAKHHEISTNDNRFTPEHVSCQTNDDNTTLKTGGYANCESDPVNDESKALKDDTTNDSGYENDSLQAYSFVKTFLFEVSSSFNAAHMFIEDSIKEFRDVNMLDTKRAMLQSKANAAHSQIIEIVDKLKSIIQRESVNGTTLKTLLASAGLQASGDKRATRYRQVVIKCLEQAQLLEKALRLMLSMPDGSFDSGSCISHSNTNVRYFNIFE